MKFFDMFKRGRKITRHQLIITDDFRFVLSEPEEEIVTKKDLQINKNFKIVLPEHNLDENLSEQEKLAREMRYTYYKRNHLFYAVANKPIEVDGQTIFYPHVDVFISNLSAKCYADKFVRLTGQDVTGEPIKPRNFIKNVNMDLCLKEGDLEYVIGKDGSLYDPEIHMGDNMYVLGNDVNEYVFNKNYANRCAAIKKFKNKKNEENDDEENDR